MVTLPWWKLYLNYLDGIFWTCYCLHASPWANLTNALKSFAPMRLGGGGVIVLSSLDMHACLYVTLRYTSGGKYAKDMFV